MRPAKMRPKKTAKETPATPAKKRALLHHPTFVERMSLTCVHLGDETGQVPCGSCGERSGKTTPSYYCEKFGDATKDRTSPGIKWCGACRSFQPTPAAKPVRTVALDLPGHFNAGLIEWKGKLLLASRHRQKLWLSDLDNLQPLSTRQVQLDAAVEDPRLFLHKGELHVSYTIHSDGIRVGYARINADGSVEDSWIPDYGEQPEKNWQFFEHDGHLLSVYSIRPHKILSHDGGAAKLATSTTHPVPWQNVHIRGGAPPVRVGDEYYHFAHTMRKTDDFYTYTCVLYTFAAKPPFQIRRVLPGHLIHPTYDDLGDYNKAVCFPCGAVLRDGQWLISYGHHDRECRIAVFDFDDIEGGLKPC